MTHDPRLRIGTANGRPFSLPPKFATKTAAILAQRRKGKTYLASVMAEEMVASKQPFVALDPTGAWWGLRADAKGGPGLPVIILGGQHGDIGLERTAGALVADLVVDEPGYYVIDFSLFESGEAERQFAVDFAERLYRAKAQPGKDFPLHVFVDEADRFVPQQMRKGSSETSPRLLGAFEALVRRGGIRGLGTTLISQRAAVVNKNVLEMLDVLFVLRTIGPNDRAAIEQYVEAHGDEDKREQLMSSLASLALGEFWVWEPGAEPALFERVQGRTRTTFNSSATPDAAQKRVEPRKLAPVDLAAINKRMAATIERAKATDPRELQKTIADLRQQLAAAQRPLLAGPAPTREKVKETIREVLVLTDTDRRMLAQVSEKYDALLAKVLAAIDLRPLHAAAAKMVADIEAANRKIIDEAVKIMTGHRMTELRQKVEAAVIGAVEQKARAANVANAEVRAAAKLVAPRPQAPAVSSGGTETTGPADKVLLALAELAALGFKKPERPIVAFLSGYTHPRTSSFREALKVIRERGLVDVDGPRLALTPTGHASAAGFNIQPPHSTEAMIARAEKLLGGKTGDLLRLAVAHWPESVERTDAASHLGYEHARTSSYRELLTRLRTTGLLTVTAKTIRATDALMLMRED